MDKNTSKKNEVYNNKKKIIKIKIKLIKIII